MLANISTRLRVETGDNVLIGGIIITGQQPKSVLLRAIGPSLNFPGALADPHLQLFKGDEPIGENDNWRQSLNRRQITDTGIPPQNDLESAILQTLDPGAYTAIVRGADGGTGAGLIEAYDLDRGVGSKFANISTRGLVQSGDDVMIGGLIVLGESSQKVIVRALGPSLAAAGITGALQDPTLELFDQNGDLVRANDNWKESQEAEIRATTIPPREDAESAIVQTLNPGAYTAVVRGVANATGIAVVEIYALQ